MDPETLRKLRATAHEKWIGPTTLVRMWILERLRDSAQAAVSKVEKGWCNGASDGRLPTSPEGVQPWRPIYRLIAT